MNSLKYAPSRQNEPEKKKKEIKKTLFQNKLPKIFTKICAHIFWEKSLTQNN